MTVRYLDRSYASHPLVCFVWMGSAADQAMYVLRQIRPSYLAELRNDLQMALCLSILVRLSFTMRKSFSRV